MSTLDFSALYTSLLHYLIKSKLFSFICQCFNRESLFETSQDSFRTKIDLAMNCAKDSIIYVCNLVARFTNRIFYGQKLCALYGRFICVFIQDEFSGKKSH